MSMTHERAVSAGHAGDLLGHAAGDSQNGGRRHGYCSAR